MQSQMIRGARIILTRLFDYLQRLIDVVVANLDEFNDYVTHNLPTAHGGVLRAAAEKVDTGR